MKKQLISRLCVCFVVALCGMPLMAQGVIVYQKDGTKVKYPYELIDSIVTYNYGEDVEDEPVTPPAVDTDTREEADEENSMKVIDANMGWKYLEVNNETDDKWLNIAAAKGVSPQKVFRADLKTGFSYLLNPLLSEELWNPGTDTRNDCIEVYGESGVKYTEGKTDGCHYESEPTKMEEEEGEYMLVQFKTRYELEDEYYIIYFVTADDVYLKALVVWNYWE